MTTIVVPLDGSFLAEHALRPACSLAARLGDARVLLVTAEPADSETARRQLEDRASLYRHVVNVETRVVTGTDTAAAILGTVESIDDALLCMATRGRGGLGVAVLGSVATQVVCRSTRPIVLVGPACRTALLPRERGRLLVCVDDSSSSAGVLPAAAEWADRWELQPCLVEVVSPDEDPHPPDHPPVPNLEVEAARRRLDDRAAAFAGSPAGVRTAVLHGAPSRAINSFAEELPAALVALATHGRRGLSRVALGSVATDVVRHAPCPVLVTGPGEPPPTTGG